VTTADFSEIRQAIDASIARLQALPPGEAVREAEHLSDLLNRAISEAAALRARAVLRLREEGDLSYGQLADLLEVSRARAAQLVKAAERLGE
jgi:DNA-directed RNA polymerase specialized sigma24 family protein